MRPRPFLRRHITVRSVSHVSVEFRDQVHDPTRAGPEADQLNGQSAWRDTGRHRGQQALPQSRRREAPDYER
jgi:hypothetical protein